MIHLCSRQDSQETSEEVWLGSRVWGGVTKQ